MRRIYIIGIIVPYFIFHTACKKENTDPVLKSDFTADKTDISIGDTINFYNHSENALFYEWSFGDDQTSHDENPFHIYNSSGGYRVLLRALDSFTSDTSYLYITVLPKNAKEIKDGEGIEELNIGDRWAIIQSDFPPIDTNYYFAYLPKYGKYKNIIYYPKKGIAFAFFSNTINIGDEDLVYEIFIVKPYEGITTKGIIIGSKLSDVLKNYGNNIDGVFTYYYTGYYYPSIGIDFYSYNDIDTALVAEIDIYNPYFNYARISINNLFKTPVSDEFKQKIVIESDTLNLGQEIDYYHN